MRKITAIFLILALCMTIAVPSALASEDPELFSDEIPVEEITADQPVDGTEEIVSETAYALQEPYPEAECVMSESEIICIDGSGEKLDPAEYSTRDEAMEALQAQMIARVTSVELKYVWEGEPGLTADEYKALVYADTKAMMSDAAALNASDPTAGDYLYFHIISYKYGYTTRYYPNGCTYYITLTYSLNYSTDAAQEQAVGTAVSSVLSGLSLDGRSDYGKFCAIYDYITENITYDYEHLSTPDYTPMFTAYAAIINKTAVCQGICCLFYRMVRSVGLDVRLIHGTCEDESGTGNHMWAIVKLGGKWYNIDPTWDLGANGVEQYCYFLKCSDNFANHNRNEVFTSSEFYAAYPMSEHDFLIGDANDDGNVTVFDLIKLMNIISSGTEDTAPAAADADGNGVIDLLDLVAIMKQLAA